MATEAKNTNYWISSSALYIQLNAMGEPDYIQCSVVSGASILCYMQGIPGLEYDAGHNYQRWPLAAYPSVFPDSERKYIYAAIPRTSTADNNTAVVVYPSERIDLYGYSIANPDKLVGDERFYYIYLQGIISEVKTDADGKTRKRDWLQHVDCGKLNTDESLSSGIDGTWWKYNSVTDSISFLKTILSATFDTLTAKVAKITKLFLGGSELNGVADDLSLETDNTKVVTPLYLGQFGVKHFLAKDKDDVAHGAITFEKVQKFLAGLNVGDSNSENGGSWTPDAEGRSHLITDYLEVRMKAIFEELVIKKTSTIGGKEIISPAGGVVAHKVEEVTVTYNNVSQKAYRCYFLAEQEGDSVDNDFAVNDQVRSESFNVRKGTYHKVGNHFYWRLVIGRDEDPVEVEGKKYHYIDLSDTDCATASDVPAKGDVLSQCGNRTDIERQNCLIFSAVDTYSPSIGLYHGINSYSFANREYVEYGVNKQTNKAFFNVYGDMYVGDRPTKENNYEGSSYIKYDSAAKQVSIKGKLSAKSTVDGKELSQYIKENSAGGLTEEQVNNLIKNSQVIADLQNQVDGAIETWFYEGVPTLKNAPASSWTTDKDKDTHLGDLYYDNKTGKAYRFAKDGNTYKWAIITDTDIAKALSDASKAQETADGKMKVFSTQPIPPYQLGDIWVNATYPTDGSIYKNEILRCQTAKAKGSSFAIADWTKASKYTDDSALNTFKEEYKNDMASYKEQLDEKVETWFYNYAPTTQNKPASDWTTDTLKLQHAGDLFYNTSNGYTYRWTGTAWVRIKDNDINTAMTAASKAQDTADGKRTVFTSQPTVPYDEGDLWASGGDDGKTLMVCVKSRTTGSFTSSEWVKANDSDLNAFAKTIEKSLSGIQDQLDKKAETWYQTADPSTSWTTDTAKKEHKGDLWYNTSNNQTFFWNGTKWDKQDVPTEVFDKIDGKSSIYVSKPAFYEERDLWILEAAYTLGGVAYSKGELVVATKTNASFSAADWTKKVKYTDDTVANAAKKAAEEAKKAADTAQTNVTNLDKTVTSNKKAFDSYVTDGYLEPSEIAAMAQDSKRLADDFAAAEKSYNEVKGAEVLKSTKELTNLNTAFTTLTTAKTELITYLSDISARYNAANTEGKATIVSAVGTKFTNFQSAYSAFYDKLGLANAYITSKIYGDLKQNITDLAGYKYIKDALGQTTDIDGGLVMTTLLALRDADGNVQSGINGAIDPNRGKKSIATWWGGQMVDKDYNSGNLTPATSLIRFDGSGYLANGAIWWDVDGKVHADPTSFIISEKNLGAYLTFFEPTWKAGSAGTSVADLVSLKPNAPFSKLGVSGDATFEGAITFHGIKLTYDATNKAIKVEGNLYATGGISAYGAGTSSSSGGGLNGSVKSYSDALKLTSESLSEIASAYSIKALDSRISSLEGGSAMDVSVSGTGNAVTAISKSGTTISVTKGTTFLTSHQSLAGYATQSWVENTATAHNADTVDGVHIQWSGSLESASWLTAWEEGGSKLRAISPSVLSVKYAASAGSVAWSNVSGRPTKVSQFTNDSGYITSSASITGNAATSTVATYVKDSFDGNSINITYGKGSQSSTSYLASWKGYEIGTISPANINVGSATKLQTARTIWGQSFDGTEDINGKINASNGIECNGILISLTQDKKASSYVIDSSGNNTLFLNYFSKGDIGLCHSGGKVGIEIDTPSEKLDVNGSILSREFIKIQAYSGYGSGAARIWFDGNTNAVEVMNNFRVTGGIIVPSGKYISIGNIKMEYDATNKALKITNTTTNEVANLYTSGGITAYGVGTSSSSGGGLNGSVKSYADALKLTSESLSDIASAYSIKQLSTRITSLEGGSATSISVSGSGNAVTSITKNGTTISVVKGSTFLTSHQSLAGYATQSWVENTATAHNADTVDGVHIQWSGSLESASWLTAWEEGGSKLRAISPSVLSVKYAASAGSVAWSNVSGRPTKVSQFTNDSGYITSSASITGNAATSTVATYVKDSFDGNSINITYGKGSQSSTSYLASWKGYEIGTISPANINVGSATKLQTARTIWGQSFDGTEDINGKINASNGIECNGILISLTQDKKASSYVIDSSGNNTLFLNYFSKGDIGLCHSGGKVGIEIDTPSEKLDVNGSILSREFIKIQAYSGYGSGAARIWFDGNTNAVEVMNNFRVTGGITGVNNITMSNNSYLYGKNTGGTAIQLIAMASWNSVDIGRGALTNGYTTQVMGKTVALTASDDSGKNVKSVELSTAKLYSNVNIETEGGLLAHGGVTAYSSSDIRLKQDLRKLDYLGIIKAMGGTFGFAWKKDNTRSIGWIAQHVLCNPHLKDIVETDEKGYYKINYWSPKLIATAFGAIEQVGDEVSRLKARVVFLESEVRRLSGGKEDCNKKRLDNKNINSLN